MQYIIGHNAEVGYGNYLSLKYGRFIPGSKISFPCLEGHRNIDVILNLNDFASVISGRL